MKACCLVPVLGAGSITILSWAKQDELMWVNESDIDFIALI